MLAWRMVLFCCISCAAWNVWAQDALRYSLTGEQAAKARSQSLEGRDYNFRLGDARFLADASLSLELNDNVSLSDSGSQEDLIIRPLVNTHMFWPVTQKNALNFSLGLGYTKYVSHSRYDYLLIAPGSELAFDLFIKDVRLTFFERFTYSQDPLQSGAVSGVAQFGGIDNSVGVNALWDMNKAVVTGGYAHQNFIPDQTDFDYLNRSSELFYGRAGFQVHPAIVVGPEVSGSLTAYDFSFLNDAFSYSAGAFGQVKLSQHMSFAAHAGVVNYTFQSRDTIGVADNPTSYYFDVSLDHTINEHISHSLQGGRQILLGIYSDFQELFYARYNINWRVIRRLGVNTQFFYEHGTYPPVIVQLPGIPQIALFGEEYDRYGPAVSLEYRLMKKLTASLAYRLTLRGSNTQSRDYTQNALLLSFNYQF